MKKTFGIVGVGNMGQAIAFAMEKIGFNLVVLDFDQKMLTRCKKKLSSKHKYSLFNCKKEHGEINIPAFSILKECEGVISSLPYHANLTLAKFCIDNQIPYFDLGGSVEVSEIINSYAKEKDQTCLTDLGLAPGWANIIAEHLCNEQIKDGVVPKRVDIMVGGLPVQPTNILKYGCNWSLDGLLNEYKEDCVVLQDGLITLEKGLDGLETVQTNLGELEAFYTSGGISHTIDSMYDKGVQNCSYKTLRYPGHNIIIKFLVRESGLTDQQIRDVLKASCPRTEDLVIISVKVDNKSHEEVIMSDDNFSAMQRATAFAASAAATSVIVDKTKGQLKYSDIKYHKFSDHLNYLLRK